MRLGIVIDKFGNNDFAKTLLKNLNSLKHLDITVFYNEHNIIPGVPLFAVMQHEYLWGFKGPVLATNIATTKRILKAPGPTQRYLYVWNYEWVDSGMSYEELQNIYQNDKLELIARKEADVSLIEQCWKKPVTLIEDFNNEQLARIAS